jgi:hypothetical protein
MHVRTRTQTAGITAFSCCGLPMRRTPHTVVGNQGMIPSWSIIFHAYRKAGQLPLIDTNMGILNIQECGVQLVPASWELSVFCMRQDGEDGRIVRSKWTPDARGGSEWQRNTPFPLGFFKAGPCTKLVQLVGDVHQTQLREESSCLPAPSQRQLLCPLVHRKTFRRLRSYDQGD